MDAALFQNHPNPFNPMTRIDFSLEKDGHVELAVYDRAGRLVDQLLNEDLGAGKHHVTWNGIDRRGNAVVAGVYQYVLKTPSGQISKRMTLVK